MPRTHNLLAVRILFGLAAVYDGLLGLAFLVAPVRTLANLGVDDLPSAGYVKFPAALLVVFAAMFAAIARRPVANRNLIPYGIGLKVAYAGVVFWQWSLGQAATLWIPFAWADVTFAIAFAWAWMAIPKPK